MLKGKYAVVTGAAKGIGACAVKRFLDEGVAAVALVDLNLEAAQATATELDPTGKHIALGGDLDGVDAMPNGFRGIQDYPKLADKLLERGLSEGMIHDIFWNNAIGVMERAVCNHKR